MKKLSPLFWPVKIKAKSVYVLDETRLPEKLVYLKLDTVSEVVSAIKEMRTRAFGQVLIVFYTFLLVLEKNKDAVPEMLLNIFKKTAKSLEGARPTFPFRDFTTLILSWAESALEKKQDIKLVLEKNIFAYLNTVRQMRFKRAKEAAGYLKNGDSVLTHCNVSGELPLLAQFAQEKGKRVSFIATETRPYFQGSRLTAWELRRLGFSVTVIPDSAVAKVMQEGKIDLVIVGADCLAQNGDIANKIGTFQIALLAKKFKIPFYVLTPPASKYKTGKDIPIEIRPEKELLEFKGITLAPKGVKGYYPAFDITPNELITKHIHL